MSLKGMYAYAVKVAAGNFQGTIEERDGKLHFDGTVATQAEKNAIWDALKTIPTWQKDVAADIRVTGEASVSKSGGAASPAASVAAAAAVAAVAAVTAKTYTVKAGDTLGKIAKDHLGSAAAYMKIFDANKDQLTDPNRIKPGQVLRLP